MSCIGQGHIGSEVFDEMVMAAKPQGYCIFTTKFSSWERHNYEQRLAEMEEQGLWKKVSHTKGGGIVLVEPSSNTCFAYICKMHVL